MAKFEESDPRWIVQDRADGTNVHNWHWKEQDCLPWAKQALQSKFAAVQLLDGQEGILSAVTDGLESVTGEAFTNIRKNKVIPSYELEIKIKWKGEVKSGGDKSIGSAKGWFHLPYLADENADEKPEVQVVVDSASDAGPGNYLRQAILVQGLPKIHSKIADFVKELSAGGPNNQGTSDPSMVTNTSANNTPSAPGPTTEKKKASSQIKAKAPTTNSSKASLTIHQEFYASPRDIYDCFVNPAKFQAFAMSPAKIEPQPGGEFSWFGGSICGRFKELESDKQIIMDWRFNNWSKGCYSKVLLEISSQQEGSTTVKLTQENIPEQDQYGNENVREVTENGWQQQIFNRIRAVFGYGL